MKLRILLAGVFAVAFAAAPAGVAADRFGPPWMASVNVEQTTVRSDADASAGAVGTLQRGAIVVVLDQRGDWTRIQDGWIPSQEVAESSEPWVAQPNDSSSVYAKPNTQSGSRRVVSGNDLLLVVGVAHGVDGDDGVWWATTEGYVSLSALHQAAADVAKDWKLPTAADAPQGWWAQVHEANVRSAPSSDAALLGTFAGGERVKVLGAVPGQDVEGEATWYRIDGGRYPGGFVHSSLVDRLPDPVPTVAPPPDGRQLGDQSWVVVDRSAHTLTLLRSGLPVFTTLVALGQSGKETPEGAYPLYLKYLADRMTSTSVADAPRSYDLPNVPFAEYFKDDGSAIHGTYWHDNFGGDESQGCVNLTWSDSAYVFQQTLPQVGDGQFRAQAEPDQATPLVILH